MLHARDLDGQAPRTPHPPWVPVVGNALPPNAPVTTDYLGVDVGSPVTKALTFLPWIQTIACAGAPPLAAVPKILLTEALLCKTQLPPSAVDAAELRNTNLLTWRPKADCGPPVIPSRPYVLTHSVLKIKFDKPLNMYIRMYIE